jgi:hypothetical protein
MPDTAVDYLRDTSMLMRDGYPEHCVAHACRVAERLHAEGSAPWIGRIRQVVTNERGELHVPLIPKRFTGAHALTWNTHYVACAGDVVYDPIVGEPVAMADYTLAVFGETYPVAVHFDSATTAELLQRGALREAFRPVRREQLTRN